MGALGGCFRLLAKIMKYGLRIAAKLFKGLKPEEVLHIKDDRPFSLRAVLKWCV